MGSKRGFTLIELLVSLGILSVLTLAVVQSLRRAMDNKKRIEVLNDHQAVLRDALDVITSDVRAAFHYRDFNQELEKAVKKKMAEIKNKKNQKNKKTNPMKKNEIQTRDIIEKAPTEEEEPVKDTSTHFYGKKNEMHFVSLNLPRIRKNQPTANYAEVGYRLDSCKVRSDQKRETKCLIRRISPVVDDKVEEGGREVALLEDVTKFELRYYGLGKLDWANEWETLDSDDEVTAGRYPQLIEVNLHVSFPIKNSDKTRNYERRRVIPILFPNNNDQDEEGFFDDDEDFLEDEDDQSGL